jgi:hypothetical protein
MKKEIVLAGLRLIFGVILAVAAAVFFLLPWLATER